MDTEYIINQIEKYTKGIIRDKNEMDKVFMQASDIQFLIGMLRRNLGITLE